MGIFTRKAVEQDIPWLLFQLQKFSKFFESKYNLFSDDINFMTAELTNIINNHFFIIAENEMKVNIGFISGITYRHPFNPKIKTFNELFWWVDENFRSTRAGSILLQEFIEYGKQNHQWVIMALEHKSPVNENTLLKRGFKNKEHTYIMEV